MWSDKDKKILATCYWLEVICWSAVFALGAWAFLL